MDDITKNTSQDRRCFLVDGDGEHEAVFESLRRGDVFYLVEPGGDVVEGDTGNMMWRALDDAEMMGGVWRIKCEPFGDDDV